MTVKYKTLQFKELYLSNQSQQVKYIITRLKLNEFVILPTIFWNVTLTKLKAQKLKILVGYK